MSYYADRAIDGGMRGPQRRAPAHQRPSITSRPERSQQDPRCRRQINYGWRLVVMWAQPAYSLVDQTRVIEELFG
jgi:hypothetical protein